MQFALNMPVAKILADQRPGNPTIIAKMARTLEQQGVDVRAPSTAAEWRRELSGDGWSPYFSVPTNKLEVRRSAVVSLDHFS